jgi:alanyl-tRNA synthetase
MLTDKQIKKKYLPIFSKSPSKHYATNTLKNQGFHRKKCRKSGIHFWTTDEKRSICGDPSVSKEEPFSFINKTPSKNKMDFIEVWETFSRMFKKLSYTPIKRYPLVARWNPTMDFTNASIAAFQPYVISGEVDPPAKKLVIPQLCFRTTDIDNVGLTMSHMTVFSMIGQHMFVPPNEWNQDEVFSHILQWLNKGLKLPNKELFFHEDSWAGGGNFGPCMEFFSRGCELGNQVYMTHEQTSQGSKELKIKVLDMGMGQERNAWFSQGTSTIYDASFPSVMKKIRQATGFKTDERLIANFVPYAGLLNVDEVSNINKAWELVAKKINTDVKELRRNLLPMASLYSIAEHSRALLVALSDGALPSNVGGSYNLRILLRRVLSFIDQYDWNLDLFNICKWHASYLKPIYPELSKNLATVEKILEVEKQKYENTKQKTSKIVATIIKDQITEKKLLELYDSQGISPELIREEALKFNKKIDVPEDFYKKVSELHEKREQIHQTKHEKELDLKSIPETEILYYVDYKLVDFTAKVEKIIKNNVILNKTAFYPTSGGQLYDLGTLNGQEVINIYKQGPYIIHELKEKPKFKADNFVKGSINLKRRIQLAKHHTSAHIINAAAKKVLGPHINQAGAKKTTEKAHLDITHFNSLTDEETKNIELESDKIISKKIPVISSILPRNKAEQRFGMSIYQGGSVPGKMIRIIDIKGTDVEACGGTHLKNTSEADKIKIIKTSKIQDGIVRIEYKAGPAALEEESIEVNLLNELAKVLQVNKFQVVSRSEELFQKWKKARKGKLDDLTLTSRKEEKLSDKELLEKVSQIFKTQKEHVVSTAKRFLDDLKKS